MKFINNDYLNCNNKLIINELVIKKLITKKIIKIRLESPLISKRL